jgi:hypothetical protein
MAKKLYVCPRCGPFETEHAADALQCRCGRTAKRRWAVTFDRTSTKVNGRWDPVVGQYVSNEREFQDALSVARELQCDKLGMDVKLETLDARDQEGLAELHGQDINERQESAAKVKFEVSNS